MTTDLTKATAKADLYAGTAKLFLELFRLQSRENQELRKKLLKAHSQSDTLLAEFAKHWGLE